MFIDSVVWIRAKLSHDQWHEQSSNIIRQFVENSERTAYINDYSIFETVNFLLRKGGFNTALATLKMFREHDRIKIIYITDDLREEMYYILNKYQGLFTERRLHCSNNAKIENFKTLFIRPGI